MHFVCVFLLFVVVIVSVLYACHIGHGKEVLRDHTSGGEALETFIIVMNCQFLLSPSLSSLSSPSS